MQHIPKAISITCHEQSTVTNDLYDFFCKVYITLSCQWANATASIRHSWALFARVVPQLQNSLLASVGAFMHTWCKPFCCILLSIMVDRELQHHTSLLCLWFLICMCNHMRLYSNSQLGLSAERALSFTRLHSVAPPSCAHLLT